MGCVSSKTDINDRHPNIFQVTNVNDQGRPISPGKLQVTETELVLYQRGKEPTKWPLRSLRKYGFDTEVFSFECGRRCPTGHGIYAFQCRKAEQLFNIVQQHITGNINDENNPMLNNVNTNNEFPVPVVSTGPPVQRRIGSGFQPDGYLNPVTVPGPTRPPHNMLSRPGSVSSNGPLSPTPISPPPDAPLEHNNNKRGSLVMDPSYTNNSVLLENGSVLPNYANLGVSPTENVSESSCHVYMNVDTKNCTKEVIAAKELTDIPEKGIDTEEKHCYVNIDTKDIENLRPIPDTHFASVPTTPTIPFSDMEYTPEYITVGEVNYAELDLDSTKNSQNGTELVPESPKVEKKSYATIDFQKTNALSQSINPSMAIEEGSRKTRHNSTINYNSLSD